MFTCHSYAEVPAEYTPSLTSSSIECQRRVSCKGNGVGGWWQVQTQPEFQGPTQKQDEHDSSNDLNIENKTSLWFK